MTNRDTADPFPSFGLPKTAILRGYGAFGRVMTGGRKLRVGALKFFFLLDSQIPPFDCMVGFAFRRPPSAVHRNRVRRVLREAYRHHRAAMIQVCAAQEMSVRCIVLYDFSRSRSLLSLTDAAAAFREFLDGIVVHPDA